MIDHTPLAEARVLVDRNGRRSFDTGGQGATICGVRFWGWQIHPLPPDENARYLVRADYDFSVAFRAPEPTTMDVRFHFLTERVNVLDAIPRHVEQAAGPTLYTLTSHLNFVAATATPLAWPDGSARPEVPLPALTPLLEVFGIGGPDLRWRHTAMPSPIRRGTHTGWFVLTAPMSVTDVQVEAHTSYESAPENDLGIALAHEPGTFTVRLPGRHAPEREPEGEVRLGFALDVVAYSDRSVQEQNDIQRRLAALAQAVVRDAGHDFATTESQAAGDSVTAFLPPTADAALVLPRLLAAAAERLRNDNLAASDRMRVRMAVTLGPIGRAALGYHGPTIVECHRLLECDPVREAIRTDPRADLAVIVSDTVHALFVRPRFRDLDPARFREVLAVVKGFQQRAWLWRPGFGPIPGD